MADELNWGCECGAVRMRIAPIRGTRCICYCRDCQAFARHLGHDHLLDAAGGSDLFQTLPEYVNIENGADRIGAVRLTDKGPIRWHAECCGTPICNTGARRGLPLVSFLVRGFDHPDLVGPVLARVNLGGARAFVPEGKGHVGRLIRQFLVRAAKSLLTGGFRGTPFFDDQGRPIRRPARLTQAERRVAYDG